MKKLIVCLIVGLMSSLGAFAADDEHEAERVKDSGVVLKEILNIPDDIPQDLLDKAECIIILALREKGSVRHRRQLWTRRHDLPERRALQRQVGSSRALRAGRRQHRFPAWRPGNRLCVAGHESEGRAIAALQQSEAGRGRLGRGRPKGRTAEGATDIVMSAEILSYSRNKGLFAGVSLEGSTLRSDGSANEKLYGKKLSAKEIIRLGKVGIPPSPMNWFHCLIRSRL